MTGKKRIVKDKETREQEILAVAREVFRKKGYTDATIEEIAQQANIAPGTIYRYFDNKDDLYTSLSTQAVLVFGELLLQIESEIDQKKIVRGHDIIMKLLDVFYRNYLRDPNDAFTYASIQSGFFSKVSPRNMEKFNQNGRFNFVIIRRIIAKGKEQGLIKPHVNEIVLADALWSTFLGLVIHEEAKKRVTGKDHVYPMLTDTFSLFADAVSI